MEKVCKRRRMTKTERPNEMQLDVYVRARMRKPVAMETAVRARMCARLRVSPTRYNERASGDWPSSIDWLVNGAVRRIPGNLPLTR